MRAVVIFLSGLLFPVLAVSQERDVSSEYRAEQGQYILDVDVSVIGAEAASKQMAAALNNLATKIELLATSEKLSEEDKDGIIEVTKSIEGLTAAIVEALDKSKDPVQDIAQSISNRVDGSVSHAIAQTKQELVDPVASKIRRTFYILILVVVALCVAAFCFVRYYVHPMVKDVTSAATAVAITIDNLPDTIEKIAGKVDQKQAREEQVVDS